MTSTSCNDNADDVSPHNRIQNLRLVQSHVTVKIYIYIFQSCFNLRLLYKAQRIRVIEEKRGR